MKSKNASFGTGNGSNTNTAKPANTTSNTANTANKSNSNSTAAKTDKPKTALANEKKTEGKAKTAKSNPVPADWIYVYDEAKGYGFSVPAGTTGGQETEDGVDAFVASTPASSELGIVGLSFKDKKMTKDGLLDVAVKFLEETGELSKSEGKGRPSKMYQFNQRRYKELLKEGFHFEI